MCKPGLLPLLLAALTFCLCSALRADTLLSTSFETDPTAQGWAASGPGATWTGTSLLAQTGFWSSPLCPTQPLQWYRVSFKTKAPGTSNPAATGTDGYAIWSADFYDPAGNLLPSDQYSSVFQSNGWVVNEFRVRAKAIAGPNGTLLPSRMQISFRPVGGLPLYIDDVSVSTTTPGEVAQWADALYAAGPKLTYVPKNGALSRLPLTMQKLRSGQNLRILFLGDSVQCDTGNAPLDVFLQREYPGSSVQIITSTGHGTGMQTLQYSVQSFVLDYAPDLVILGGISNTDDMTAFQNVVDQERASDAVTGHATEFLAVTKNWSPNVPHYILSPAITELDQNPARNAFVPIDYRGHLLQWASAQGIEFLDMTGIASAFIYGPAAQAGFGPPDNTGVPYSHWMRDHTHSNDYGKQILGRILEAYFAPVISFAPTNLTAQAGNAKITLSWRAGAGAQAYNVYRRQGNGMYALLSRTATLAATDASVTNGVAYSYLVTTATHGAPQWPSNPVSATPLAPPDAPTGFAAQSHNGYAILSWNASAGAIGYYLYRGGVHGGPYAAIASPLITNFLDVPLANGTPYFYTVTAIGAGGESLPAPEASVTPLGPPLAPTGLTAMPGKGQITLAWTASASAFGASDAANYQIGRALVSAGPFVALSAKPAGTSYTDVGLVNGTTYYYVLWAGSAQGKSAYSAQASATPLP